MNRLFKIAVVSLLTLAGLLIVAFVLLRCVFRDEATAMLLDRQKKERVELLRSAAAYAAEPGADYRFTYRQDTAALGKTAAAKLIELIEKPRTALVDRILIPGKLVEGCSVRAI